MKYETSIAIVSCVTKNICSTFLLFIFYFYQRFLITWTSLCFISAFMGTPLSAAHIYPRRVVLYSAHGMNEYIDLHFRLGQRLLDGDDNISAGNKVRRLKMDPSVRGEGGNEPKSSEFRLRSH